MLLTKEQTTAIFELNYFKKAKAVYGEDIEGIKGFWRIFLNELYQNKEITEKNSLSWKYPKDKLE